MRRLFWICIVSLSLVLGTVAQTTEKSRVVVMEFETIGVAEKHVGRAITEKIVSELVATNRYTVVERTQVEKILQEQKLQLSGLVDEATAVEIGHLLGAELLAMGSISQIGQTYNVIIRFVDCQTGQVTLSRTSRTEDINAIPEMIEYMVAALVDKKIIKKTVKKPGLAFAASLILPGTGQAYAGSSTKRIIIFSCSAIGIWGAMFIGHAEWKKEKDNADYLYSKDPSGNDPAWTIYDEVEGKDLTAAEWREQANQSRGLSIVMGVFAAAFNVWAAFDASSQAQKYNKEKGFMVTFDPRYNEVQLVYRYTF
jgi:TolB-like protein